jgi:hypothetical protein
MALSDRLTKIGLFGGPRRFFTVTDKPPAAEIDLLKNALMDFQDQNKLLDFQDQNKLLDLIK